MVPVPVIEVGEGKFQLNNFIRAYWYLFVLISLFTSLSVILTLTSSELGSDKTLFELLGIPFNMQEICIASCLALAYLCLFAVLWAAFAEPRDKPIFYYFIGVESFKRLLLVIPLVILMLSLTAWIALAFTQVLTIIFSFVGFCLGIVCFSSILIVLSKNTTIKRIVLVTMVYALLIFCFSLAFLLLVDLRNISSLYYPLIYFVYAMGIASVFYVIANLIFEIVLPLFEKA